MAVEEYSMGDVFHMKHPRQGSQEKAPRERSSEVLDSPEELRQHHGTTVCTTCPHACHLREGEVGYCRARECRDGTVVPQNYGRVTSLAVDPIEKKPLADYLPGSTVLSVGSYGCNLRCPFCQNWQISQADDAGVPWRQIDPADLVRIAATIRNGSWPSPADGSNASSGNGHEVRAGDPSMVGIAYTYNEPLVGWEFVGDCSQLAHEAGLVNVLVSNGCANAPVIRELAPLVDAANIDLKAFTDEFYRTCAGSLPTVKETIRILAATPTCHLELTTLVIPGMNDSPAEMERIARWVAELPSEGDPITLHVTRFFPRWRLRDRGPTPVARVYELADVARRWLPRVRVGNC